jgi:hypothetical protein
MSVNAGPEIVIEPEGTECNTGVTRGVGSTILLPCRARLSGRHNQTAIGI